MHLGVNNCFAVKRWTEPERWLSIVGEEMDLDCVQISMDVLDLDIEDSEWRAVSAKIRRLAEKFGVSIHSLFGGLISYSYNGLLHPDIAYRNRRLSWFSEAIWKTAEVGAASMGGPLGALTSADYHDARRREYLKEVLVEELVHLADVARSAGLKSLLWEPTPLCRELSHTTVESMELFERVNRFAAVPLKFNLDLGHQCSQDLSGEETDPYFQLEKLLPMAEAVHLQQTDGVYDRHWSFTEDCNARGIIDGKRIMDMLREKDGNDLYLLLELIHPFEESDEKVLSDWKRSVEYWKSLMA